MEQEKFSWKEMSWKQRVQYFMDYYFKSTVVILLILALVISLIKTIFFDKTETMLSGIVLNEGINLDLEAMEQEVKELGGWMEEKQTVSFTIMNTGDYQMEMAVFTRLQTGSADILICDRDTFDAYAENGYFAAAKNYVPEGMDLTEVSVTGRILERDEEGEVIGKEEELVYGFDLSGSEKYKELGGSLPDPVLAVLVNAEHPQAAETVLSYFFAETLPDNEQVRENE